EPDRLPLPFRILGITPGRWAPEVVVSRHNGLFRNASQEVQYARLVHEVGPERARALLNLRPGRPDLGPDDAIDLSLINRDILTVYSASRSPIRFRPEDAVPEFRAPESRPEEDEDSTAFLPYLENSP